MSEPVRVGLVGYGLGGRVFHAPLLASAAEATLVGVVTTSPDRIAQLSTDHPGVPAVASLEALRDAGAEAVVISSATGSHSELTDAALDLGLHVVCDKPLAVDRLVVGAHWFTDLVGSLALAAVVVGLTVVVERVLRPTN